MSIELPKNENAFICVLWYSVFLKKYFHTSFLIALSYAILEKAINSSYAIILSKVHC